MNLQLKTKTQLYNMTIRPYQTWEGFRIEFEKTLPQVVIAPYSLRNCSSHKSK